METNRTRNGSYSFIYSKCIYTLGDNVLRNTYQCLKMCVVFYLCDCKVFLFVLHECEQIQTTAYYGTTHTTIPLANFVV